MALACVFVAFQVKVVWFPLPTLTVIVRGAFDRLAAFRAVIILVNAVEDFAIAIVIIAKVVLFQIGTIRIGSAACAGDWTNDKDSGKNGNQQKGEHHKSRGLYN